MKLSFARGGQQAKKATAKKLVLKTVFNSRDHKRAVTQAARESAADQRRVMRKYLDAKK